MLKNYLLITFRQFRKQGFYSAIKVGGFAIGIAACLVIALYIRDELSYDKQWANRDQIYRVVGLYENQGRRESGASWPAPMVPTLKNEIPEVEISGEYMSSSLFYGAGSNQVKPANRTENSFEEGFAYADENLLKILQMPMAYGDYRNALADPYTLVLTKRKAEKFFPGINPVGQTLILNNDREHPYRIGGVMEDRPHNSFLQFDYLLTMTGHELWPGESTTWDASNHVPLVRIKAGTDREKLRAKLDAILNKYYIARMREQGHPDVADDFAQHAHILLQRIDEIHFNKLGIGDDESHGDERFVWLFGAVALFILALACINFVNLATAKSANRAKEVGLRKVVGSLRSGLIRQFLTESLVFSLLSFLLGMIIAVCLLPWFNHMAGKQLQVPWSSAWLLPVLTAAALVLGIVAGIYPSLYLSRFRPIEALKGKPVRGTRGAWLRNGLVVFQFATSIALIIGTAVIYKQLQFILNSEIGYDRDQVLTIQGTNTLDRRVLNFRDELRKLPGVKSVSVSDFLPTGDKRNGNTFWIDGQQKQNGGAGAQSWDVDEGYLKTLGIQLKEGRNFSPEIAADSQAVIINETLARKLGLTNAIGKHISNGWQSFLIVGVIGDIQFTSMKEPPSALVLHRNFSSSVVSVKLSGKDMPNTLAQIRDTWKSFAPDQPIRYTFMDETFRHQYEDLTRTGRIFTTFAVLAILIACLGLFALSAFMAEQRNKEIGIRKVLGASVSGITVLLSKDFLRLVVLAFLIAAPLGWWAMNRWLQDYAHRTEISWTLFAATGFIAIAIAWCTISFQSIRAARANPVDSLKSE